MEDKDEKLYEEIIKEVEALVGHKIEYKYYKDNAYLLKRGRQVEELVKKAQERIPKYLINIEDYSPLIMDYKRDELNPTWQVAYWDLFMDDDGNIDLEKTRGKTIIVEKGRQIGFTYVSTILFTVIGLLHSERKFMIGVSTKVAAKKIVKEKYKRIFPYMAMDRRERSELLRDIGLPINSVGWNDTDLIYSLPDLSTIQLFGIDKTQGSGNRGESDIDIVMIDEAAYIEKVNDFVKMVSPWLIVKEGLKIYGSTHNGDSWFRNVCLRASLKGESSYVHLKYPFHESGMLSEQRAKRVVISMYKDLEDSSTTSSHSDICREVAQEFFLYSDSSSGDKKLFPKYLDNVENIVHPGKTLEAWVGEYGKQIQYFLGIDYGLTIDPSSAMLCAYNISTGFFYVLDEVYFEDFGLQEFVNRIFDMLKNNGLTPDDMVENFICRSAKTTTSRPTKEEKINQVNIFSEYGLEVSPIFYCSKADRIDIVNEKFLIDPVEHPHLSGEINTNILISDTCINLNKQLKDLAIKYENNKIKGSFGKLTNDHAMDAFIYVVSGVLKYYGNFQKTKKGYKKKLADRNNLKIDVGAVHDVKKAMGYLDRIKNNMVINK